MRLWGLADCGLGFSTALELAGSLAYEPLLGRAKPPNFLAFLVTEVSSFRAAAGHWDCTDNGLRGIAFWERREGSHPGSQPCEKSVPGSEWVLGNGKSRGRKPPARKHSANRGHAVHTLKYTAPRGPASEGSELAGPRAPWFSVQTDSAGDVKIGAECGRRPPVLGLQLGRDGRRPVGLTRGSRARRGATTPEVKHEFSPDKIRLSTSQLAQPSSRNQ